MDVVEFVIDFNIKWKLSTTSLARVRPRHVQQIKALPFYRSKNRPTFAVICSYLLMQQGRSNCNCPAQAGPFIAFIHAPRQSPLQTAQTQKMMSFFISSPNMSTIISLTLLWKAWFSRGLLPPSLGSPARRLVDLLSRRRYLGRIWNRSILWLLPRLSQWWRREQLATVPRYF